MLSHGIEFAKYGVQTTFYWSFEDVTVTDAPFLGVAPVAADIFISKDGGAPAAASNAMTAIGNGIYSHVVTATEMQATRLSISVYDQTASEIFKPAFMVVLTKLQLGQIDVDATQIGGNVHGVLSKGVGTGNGIYGQGGATGNGVAGLGGATSGDGIRGQGNSGAAVGHGISGVAADGGGSGVLGQGRVTGHGMQLTGGATSGNGLQSEGGAPNGIGISAVGDGSGHGILALADLTGNGIQATGGATSGTGIKGEAVGGNSQGIFGQGFGSGNGVIGIGGATGSGLEGRGGATSGTGILGSTQAGNSSGISGSGRGTGQGLNTTHATDNSLMTNVFDTLEGTEPSGAIANNATFKQIFQYVKRRFTNLVTQTSSVQTWFKDDSVTTLTTEACSNDGTTQSKGKSS